MVVAVAGEAHGAADGVLLAGAAKAVVAAIILGQSGVRGTALEEPRAEQRPQPRRSAAQLHARRRQHCSLSIYQEDKHNAHVSFTRCRENAKNNVRSS